MPNFTTLAKNQQRSRVFIRSQAVLRAQRRLETHSYPRLQMTLIAALTGGVGFLASYVLLNLGLDTMALRYPAALALAYVMFLFFVWLWLRTDAEDYGDMGDFLANMPTSSGGGCKPDVTMQSGGGGDFAGAGASGSFDGPQTLAHEDAAAAEGIGEAIGSVADTDGFAIPLIAIVMALGLALASFYVIYIAPTLLAEVFVDSALSYGLYRYIRGDDPQHWLATAVRRTILPFCGTALFLVIIGAAMAAYVPGARSISEVIHQVSIP